MIKKIFKWLFLACFIAMLVFLAAFFVLSIEQRPLISEHQNLSYDNVNRVKKIIKQVKPYRMRLRQTKKFTISESDLNLVASYGITQALKADNLFARVELSDNRIEFKSTVNIGSTPLGEYLNVFVAFNVHDSKIGIESLRIGRAKIPTVIIKPALRLADQILVHHALYKEAKENAGAVKAIVVRQDALTALYEWDPKAMANLQENGKSLLVPADHQDRLLAYHGQLVEILKPHQGKTMSVAGILPPMFAFAAQKSAISNNPAGENKALIQVLSLYSTNRTLRDFLQRDKAGQVRRPPRVKLTLKNRSDLAKHFLVSAGIAVSAGSTFANFIGLAKEVDDSDQGSGFSFADLAADRSGVRLGELSIASPSQANALQQQMTQNLKESDFMPDIGHLPEGIMKLEFKKRYKDFDSETYALIDNEIQRRINNCRIYQ